MLQHFLELSVSPLLGGWHELPLKNCQEEAAAQQRVAFSSHSLCTESRFGSRNEKLYLKQAFSTRAASALEAGV